MILNPNKAELQKANALVFGMSPSARVTHEGGRWRVYDVVDITFMDGGGSPETGNGKWEAMSKDAVAAADSRAADRKQREANAIASKRGVEALIADCPTWPEAGERYYEWFHSPDKHGFYRDCHLRGESLDRPFPETEQQKARREELAHKKRMAEQQQNEILRKQIRYQLERMGVDNVPAIRKILRRM